MRIIESILMAVIAVSAFAIGFVLSLACAVLSLCTGLSIASDFATRRHGRRAT